MNRLTSKTAIAVALLLSTTVLAACGKKEDKVAASVSAPSSAPVSSSIPASVPAPSSSVPSTSIPSTPASSAGAPSAAASTASASPTSVSSGAGDVPAECDVYIRKVNACMDKLGANSPAVATFRQQLDAARAQWATVPDKVALAAQCKESTDLFTQSATQMGCQ